MFIVSIIALITALVTILTTGGVFNVSASKIQNKVSRKGLFLILLLSLLAYFTVQDKIISDTNQTRTNTLIDSLNMESTGLRRELQFLSEKSELDRQISSLRFDSAQNTIIRFKEIAQRESYISELDRKLRIAESRNLNIKIDSLESQLERANNLEEILTSSRGARLDICDYLNWSNTSADSFFTLQYAICNDGSRAAKDIVITTYIWALEKESFKITQSNSQSVDMSGFWHLPPDPKRMLIKPVLSNVNIKLIENDPNLVLIALIIDYRDDITNSDHQMKRYYHWNGYKENGLKFEPATDIQGKFINDQIKRIKK